MSEELFPVEAPAHRPRRRTPKSPSSHRPATPVTADLFDLPEADESVVPAGTYPGSAAKAASGEREQPTGAVEPAHDHVTESSEYAEGNPARTNRGVAAEVGRGERGQRTGAVEPALDDVIESSAHAEGSPARTNRGVAADVGRGERGLRTGAVEPVPDDVIESSEYAEGSVHDEPSTPESSGRGEISAVGTDVDRERAAGTDPAVVRNPVATTSAAPSAVTDAVREQAIDAMPPSAAANGHWRGSSDDDEPSQGSGLLVVVPDELSDPDGSADSGQVGGGTSRPGLGGNRRNAPGNGYGGADARGAGEPGRGFELCGELPSGTTVLEASAGTGKTYAIVGLAVRYVAERGVDISELLLVTFSRAATQELRERTRDRFVAAAAALADPESAARGDDELTRHLAQADSAEVRLRRSRLLAALSEFDAGTIATTHSFCQRMLDELGLAGEHDPGVRLVENVDDLVATVTEDLFLARYARAEPPFSMKDAHALAAAAVRDRQARLVPEDDRGDATASERVAFGAAVSAETERRKRFSGIRDFDDLLVLLSGLLADPVHGERARERIRERFRVALVDEFQDTDPLQWEILRRCFHEHATLVLVGDPKQAIYAFRGAEVLSYLDAVAVADQRRELTVNRRSDAGLLAALNHLMGGAALGHKEIGVHPVAAVRPHTSLSGEGDRTPLRLRWFRRTGAGPLNKSGFPAVGRQRARVAEDLAADIVQQLDSGLRIGERPLGPGDIAVLVRTRSQIDVVQAALDEVGVASVLAGGASVFATRSATDWLWLLRALEQPHRADRVRLAAATPLLGYSAAEIDSGGADLVGRVGQQLRESARLFGRAGFAAVAERLAAETRLAPRLLAIAGGERELTDLRHIAQLIDQVALRESLGLSALTRWLGDRVRDPASGAVADRSRRLDRDAAAVQVATVHASKGLEFPLVYLPFAWDNARNPYPATLMFHDERGKRVLDVGGPEAVGYNDRKRRSEAEEAGEELRLLYVALTRAQCQVVAWWAPTYGTAAAPLHRMMLGRMPGSAEVPGRGEVPADNVVGERLSHWAQGAPDGVVAVRPVEHAAAVRPRWERAESDTAELAAARFDRVIDQDWRRTSYSALTAGAHEMHIAESEADTGVSDEPAEPFAELPGAAEFASAAPSLMNDLPYGADFGTLVHGVLEYVDTDAPDLAAEVRTRCADAIAELLADIDPDALATALLAVLHTPMATGSLAEISSRDRLSELDFELPLAGGDTPCARRVTVRRIADLLREHLPADDPFAGYADQLDTLPDTPLRGFLTGSIDVVLRTAGPRFVVVDYKTNRLGTGDLTVAHYTRERMAAEMMRSHYPLQAILYSAALHRYLRWRLPDYDPARHLGGIRYLFVRGMIGPATPPGCGVFDWDPPPALAGALSDLLAGRWR